MELDKVASELYRNFHTNAEKLARESVRLQGLLEETAAAVMMEIEREKYKKDSDPAHLKECRRIYRYVRKEIESIDSVITKFGVEQERRKERAGRAKERIDYDQYRVDETVAYTLESVITNKKPSAFSLYGQKVAVDSWKQMLLQTCAMLNRLNPMLFASFEADPDLQGRKRPYFSATGAGLDTPAKIPDADLYVETHVSARYLKKMIMNLLTKFGIPHEEFLIFLKKDFTALHEEEAVQSRTREEETEVPDPHQLSFVFDSEGNPDDAFEERGTGL